MAFRDSILVYSQPGALPAPALEDIIEKIKELDMEDVRSKLSQAQQAQATGTEA